MARPLQSVQQRAAPVRLGIAGLGTVGVGLIRQVAQNGALIAQRAGREVVIAAVSARSRTRDRGIDISGYDWADDPVALAARDDIDVFVELMGGSDGPAKAAVEAAIAAGKHVVTANKALLAHHGQALAEAAEAAGVSIRFEAAVAGGIPVVKALNEGLAGNRITKIMGVVNGSCNYILTRMESTGQSYETVFDEALKLGYLEADPELDVGGIDAAHKLALLAAMGFGTRVAFDAVELQGIGAISIDDIRHAADMGFRVKLLGVAQMSGRGLEQRMTPCLVPVRHPLGQLDGGTNMVVIEGDAVGQIVLRGPGAGEGPTASAVIGDVIDLARGVHVPAFGQPAATLTRTAPAQTAVPAPWYLRMVLLDKPGALARIATALGEAGVSIDRMRQYDHEGADAPVLIVTHRATRGDIDQALARFAGTGVLVGDPVAIRIEEM